MIKNIVFSFLVFIIASPQVLADDMCAFALNSINPDIVVTIEPQKNGNYRYKYIVINQNDGRLPINWFLVETNKLHEEIKSPIDWGLMNWGKGDVDMLKWATQSYKKGHIQLGNTLGGFEFSSKEEPGLVKFRSQGSNYLPSLKQNVSHQSVKGLCPGDYQAGSSLAGFASIEGLTLGPIPDNRKSADMRIKRISDKSWLGDYKAADKDLLAFSPLEKGQVEVALLSSEKLDAEEVDATTIEFGRGKAKPIKAGISDCDVSPTKRTKALVMTFNLEDINVLCNADHALFLNAKTKKGLNVFGGVKIRPTECTQENWKREADKMISSDELDLPEGQYKIK